MKLQCAIIVELRAFWINLPVVNWPVWYQKSKHHSSSPAEHYDIGNRELLAVKLALEEWRQWLEGAKKPFLLWTDHKNLDRSQATELPPGSVGKSYLLRRRPSSSWSSTPSGSMGYRWTWSPTSSVTDQSLLQTKVPTYLFSWPFAAPAAWPAFRPRPSLPDLPSVLNLNLWPSCLIHLLLPTFW